MSRSRVSSQSVTKAKQKKSVRGAKGIRRVDLIPMQEAVFQLSPAELKEILLQPIFEVDDVAEVEDSKELNPDDGADTDEPDNDELADNEQPRIGEQEMVLPAGACPEFDFSPVISLKDVYPLIVGPGENGHWYCRFEAPNWMYGRLTKEGKEFVSILRSFLFSLAYWFEEMKQDFLGDPTPANFVRNEDFHPDNCIVLQKELPNRVNPRMPKGNKMSRTYFNRLYDKIWLFWPERSMPLTAIFAEPSSLEFKKAWVIAGCIDNYRDNPKFLEVRTYHSFENKDYDNYKGRFEGLNPEKRLYVLCKTVGLADKPKINSIFLEIQRICGVKNG